MLRSAAFFLPILCIAFFTACKQNNDKVDTAEGFAAFSADSLAENIKMLASDSFMGRKPFTQGETHTISFLLSKFKSTGIEPGNGESYLQEVPMVNIQTTADPIMKVESPTGNYLLKGYDDYVIWTDRTDSVISLNKDEVIFAGYGVVAPEYNWNDYAGMDVKGKVVMVLVNDPGFGGSDTTFFKGDTMTYYGRWTYKFEEAARQGAKGCLIIHDTKAASYGFSVVQNNWNGSRLHLDNRGIDEKLCPVIGWVTHDAAIKLMTSAGKDTALLAQAKRRDFKAVPLSVKLTTSMTVKANYIKSYNVVGKITGSKYPDEVLIYSAHWDHLGFGKADEKGDTIYNGALDNASATAGLLELARAFKHMQTPPERTILFLSVTAEEQGLWGSAYYAQNPIYAASKTVANINMDGLNSFGKTKDIVVVGQGQSDLEDLLKEEAEMAGRYISFDTHPEAGYYFRSDHFNFAKVGIPALYTNSGIDVVGRDKEYGQKMHDDYTAKRYHRPSDEYDAATWKLDGAIDDLQLLFKVGVRLGYSHNWPGWKDKSEFKGLRK